MELGWNPTSPFTGCVTKRDGLNPSEQQHLPRGVLGFNKKDIKTAWNLARSELQTK